MHHKVPHSIYHRAKPAAGVRISLETNTTVFVTVCTKDRMPWLACDEAHRLLTDVWKGATAWLVGSYVLMPDHLHLFAAPRDLTFTIDQWVQYWKSRFTKLHRHEEWRWQTAAFHHRLRDDENRDAKWVYMQENPIRAGLVKTITDWPFKGTIHTLGR